MPHFLADGHYDFDTGLLPMPAATPDVHDATDNLQNQADKPLPPHHLMEIAVEHGLHFSVATQEGVFFHLIGASSDNCGLGVVRVSRRAKEAARLHEDTVNVPDEDALRGT